MSSLQFEGALPSGIKFQIHSADTFSGLEELAVIIEGKPVTILTIVRKKNGAIEVKPVMSSKIMLSAGKEAVDETPVRPRRVVED